MNGSAELPPTADGAEASKPKPVAMDLDELDGKIQHQLEALHKGENLNTVIENLLVFEKQTRLAADVAGSKKLVLAIIGICRDSGNWKALNDYIVLLSKRRAQLKQAVSSMVQEAMSYIDQTPDLETRIELIKTLSNVTTGKIYVEIERARLGKKLAKIKEEKGEIKEAAEILQEIAVETFGTMAKTEKIAFILEQVRLCLDHGDFIRAQILAKKINPRVFAEETEGKKKVKEGESVVEPADVDIPPLPVLKLIYYSHMIRYYVHLKDYLEICRCYQSIYNTSSVKENPSEWVPILRKICWYIVLSSHGSMQSSLLHIVYEDKNLQEIPKFKSLLKKFITMEIVQWPSLVSEYEKEMFEEKEIFDGESGKKAFTDLQLRTIEHNILVVSKYYSRITIARLSQLLDLSIEETEKNVSDMVVSKALTAKMDRPAGIVSFLTHHNNEETLNGWANRIEKLLDLVDTSCHHIHKELMVHKVALVK